MTYRSSTRSPDAPAADPVGATEPAPRPANPADEAADPFARLSAAQRRAVRENVAAVAWLAATVLDAAPGLRPARYRDALDQARAAGIATGDLPEEYHPGLDSRLRKYRAEAEAILGQLDDPDD